MMFSRRLIEITWSPWTAGVFLLVPLAAIAVKGITVARLVGVAWCTLYLALALIERWTGGRLFGVNRAARGAAREE